MFNLVALSALRRVCLYLPELGVAKLVASIFDAEGLAASRVATLGEFERLMRSQHITAIITVSSRIAEIRDVSDLPVIDIQPLVEDWRQMGAFGKQSASKTLTFLRGTCFVAMRR